MSSSESFDSLLCSSPSDNKNFSSSMDDASKFTSSNSLNVMGPGDLPNDEKEPCPMDEDGILNPVGHGEGPTDMDGEVGNGCSTGPSSEATTKSEVEAIQSTEGGSSGEDLGSDASDVVQPKNRKRFREKVEDDGIEDEDAPDESAREVLHKKHKGDRILEPTDPDNAQSTSGETARAGEDEEDSNDFAPEGLPAPHDLPLTSSSSSDSDSDDYGDNFEDFFLHRDLFVTRRFGQSKRNKKNQEEAEKRKAMLMEDEASKFHYKLLELVRRREIGYAPRLFNGYKGYQEAIVRDVDIVRKFGLIHRYEEHHGCVNSLHFNDAGNLIASGSDDMSVVVYDWIKEKVSISFATHHKENIFQTKFMPHSCDSHIVTSARDGAVRIAQLSTTGSCRSHKKLATHKGAAHKLALLHDSPHEFYSCGEDGMTYRIDLRIGKPSLSFVTKNRNKKVVLYSIHANPMMNHEVCVVGRDPYVRIFDVRNINKNKEETFLKKFYPEELRTGYDHITAAVYNYNGSEIIASYNDDDIYLFDAAFSDGAGHLKKFEGHKNSATVKGVNLYGAKSEYIVSGSDCGNIFIWDKETEELVNIFHGDDAGVVNVIECHPTLPMIATSGLDSDVKLWSPDKIPASDLEKYKLEKSKNKRLRKKSHRFYAEFDDNRLLWFLMRTLRRNAGGADSSSESSTDFAMVTDDDNDDDDDDDANDDDEGQGRQNIQCASS